MDKPIKSDIFISINIFDLKSVFSTSDLTFSLLFLSIKYNQPTFLKDAHFICCINMKSKGVSIRINCTYDTYIVLLCSLH